MGQERPRKITQKDRAEEILHVISTSSNEGKTHQATLTEIQLSTPEEMAAVVSDMDKGKQGRKEEWPKLTHQREFGGGTQKTHVEVNGIVNWGGMWGEQVVEIMPEDVAKDDMKWAPSVIVYFVGVTPSIGAMERFANEEERDKVLCAGPHYLLKRPVIMKPWLLEFNFKEEILTTIPLWIKLPNFPLNCWNSVVLSKIGNSLGKPLYADECTTQASRISFTRILIEMDVTRPLPKMIKIRDHKGKVLEQQPKVIPAKRGQGQGQRKEWRQTTIGDKNQEKQTEQQLEPIPEVGAQSEKQGPQEQDTDHLAKE
ncbi:hypothetical protein KY290_028345 [Solanum tuberosum]|uniref:DUF4283 domain-containing protein n=1 Tax=Solanum tuberosum TaxID=4113 RepID=A0ABQ7UIU1_SOLTU|nr:hypothetical protein KY290_028345 [Solanum tuberosum]